MFGNRQLAVFEGKCRRFRNSSECLKTHCGVQIIDQFGRKRCKGKRKDVDYKLLISTYQVSSAKLDSQSAQRMKSLMPWPGIEPGFPDCRN